MRTVNTKSSSAIVCAASCLRMQLSPYEIDREQANDDCSVLKQTSCANNTLINQHTLTLMCLVSFHLGFRITGIRLSVQLTTNMGLYRWAQK